MNTHVEIKKFNVIQNLCFFLAFKWIINRINNSSITNYNSKINNKYPAASFRMLPVVPRPNIIILFLTNTHTVLLAT